MFFYGIEDFEEVIVYKKIPRRRNANGSERRVFSPDRASEDESWERAMHAADDRGSISDWLWCSVCDEEFAEHRETKGETCVHCLYLITKSWRAAKGSDTLMFTEGKLTMDYDLQGERRGGRVCVPRGPEGGRDRASRSGRDALAEPEKGRPMGRDRG